MAKKKNTEQTADQQPETPETEAQTSAEEEGEQTPEGADTSEGERLSRGVDEVLDEIISTTEKPAPSQIRILNRNGHCGNCGNPHIAKYGEGKWKCVCGAGNI